MKKYLSPIITVIIGGIVVFLFDTYFNIPDMDKIILIAKAIVYFIFGVTLNNKNRRKQYTWVKKLIVAFAFTFILVWQMGYVILPTMANIFNFLGLTSFGFSLIYIYCGWIFFD